MPVATVPQIMISIEINALIELYFNEHEETYNLNVYNILYTVYLKNSLIIHEENTKEMNV